MTEKKKKPQLVFVIGGRVLAEGTVATIACFIAIWATIAIAVSLLYRL